VSQFNGQGICRAAFALKSADRLTSIRPRSSFRIRAEPKPYGCEILFCFSHSRISLISRAKC
jgi:hypothetical protein